MIIVSLCLKFPYLYDRDVPWGQCLWRMLARGACRALVRVVYYLTWAGFTLLFLPLAVLRKGLNVLGAEALPYGCGTLGGVDGGSSPCFVATFPYGKF